MKRWWYKHEGGGGIVPVEEAAWFQEGRDYHEDFAAIAEAPDSLILVRAKELIEAVEERIHANFNQPLQEALTRRAGWLAANALYIEPAYRAEYETVAIEHELVLERGQLWIAVTPDRLGRRRSDSRLVYRDYKGVGGWGPGKSWMDHWPYAIQMHTVLKAIEEEFKEVPAFGQIMGLLKGQNRDGKLRHPYVWAYSNADFSEWEIDYYAAKRKGLTLAPVWEYPQGIFAWVERLGAEVAKEQFPFSAPIYLDERKLDELIASRTRREKTVSVIEKSCHTNKTLRAIYFEPRFSQCLPDFGASCPYLAACHNATINDNPLKSGLFAPRVPHHELEIIGKETPNEQDT